MHSKLSKDVILFDGAMGTYLAQKYKTNIRQIEYQNIYNPDYVLEIHREYIKAGADAIKTNTFSANTIAVSSTFEVVEQVIEKGCEIAIKAACDTDTLVFGSIGPILSDDNIYSLEEYKRNINVFLKSGVRNFLFETFSEYEILIELSKHIKSIDKRTYIITECTVTPDGYTQSGISAQSIVDELSALNEIDACGFNCTCGPLHLLNIVKKLDFRGKTFSVMPNAGYPTVISGRTVFESTPEYFSKQLAKLMSCGVKFIGGCCGTTPLHIEETSKLIHLKSNFMPPEVKESKPQIVNMPQKKVFEKSDKKYIAVELDSPIDSNLDFFINSAKLIKEVGADIITIADCPIARARMDSSMLAAKLKREYSIDVMPHLTCRDRNLNATKALLLGLNAENITNVLVVTGDPIATSERNDIKSVFNFNSVKLSSFINDLNQTIFIDKKLNICAALNVNAVNFTAELEKAKRKEHAGVSMFLTQPIYSDEAISNLIQAKKQLSAHILGGIMPVISYRNACFINNEIAGITIPQEIVDRYENADPLQAKKIAIETSFDIADRIKNIADGYYIVTPLKKVDIICEIVSKIRDVAN